MEPKIIVITGCSKKDGVGYNLAQELLKRGHRVIATVRNLEKSDLQKKTSPAPENLNLKRLDLSDNSSIKKFVEEVLREYQSIDVLVNNAADVTIGPVETATAENIQTTFQTKVFGPIELIKGFLPSMRKRRHGMLITTSSIFCTRPVLPPGFPIYLSALCAFERIQEALALELAPWNIKVVNYQPGPITTNLTRHEGSRTDITESFYKDFTTNSYGWYQKNTEWQNAQEVAKVYADIIETEKPNFNYQSNQFGVDFVKKYRPDNTGNSYLDEFLHYFKSLKIDDPSAWHLSEE